MRTAAIIVLSIVLPVVGGCGIAALSPCPQALVSPAGDTGSSFAYTRMGPDGSMLSGQIDMAMQSPPDDARQFQISVTFRAEGVVFSPQQAHAIEPTFDWPASVSEYPLDLTGLCDKFSYRLALPRTGDPGEVAVFWSYGLYHYLGMHSPPTHFVARHSTIDRESQTLLIRGVFQRDGRELGHYSFTFRAGRGLCGIAGVLADGTVVTMVELGGAGPGPAHPPAPDDDLWFAHVR